MSKKRVGIYIDEGVWEDIREKAWRERKSMSEYVEDMLSGISVKELVEDVIIPEKVYRDTDQVIRGDMVFNPQPKDK